MTRNEIMNAYKALEQIKEAEKILAKMKGDAKGHWWKIEIPSMEIHIDDKDMRGNFLVWLEAEIEKLKQKHGIES